MNKNDFFKKLVSLYEDFNDKNTLSRLEAYSLVLNECVNYDELYIKLIQTYKSLSFAPSPAVLYEIVKDSNRTKEQEEQEEKRERELQEELFLKEKKEQERQEEREKRLNPTPEQQERIKQAQERMKTLWRC